MTDFITFAARRHVHIRRTGPETIEVNGLVIHLWNVGDDLYRTISPLGLASARAYSLAEVVCKFTDNPTLLKKWKAYVKQCEKRREGNRRKTKARKGLSAMGEKGKSTR